MGADSVGSCGHAHPLTTLHVTLWFIAVTRQGVTGPVRSRTNQSEADHHGNQWGRSVMSRGLLYAVKRLVR